MKQNPTGLLKAERKCHEVAWADSLMTIRCFPSKTRRFAKGLPGGQVAQAAAIAREHLEQQIAQNLLSNSLSREDGGLSRSRGRAEWLQCGE